MKNQSSHLDYLTGIDGLRAIAVLAVIIYAIDLFTFLPGGFTGIDVFFVISGYVISQSLFKKAALPFPCYLTEFYKKRILRIYPALIVCLIVTVVASALFLPIDLSSAINETGLAAFFGLSNFALIQHTNGYFSPRSEFNPFLHTWSLGVEAQFYLFFPLLFFVWLKFSQKGSLYGYVSRGLFVGLMLLSLVYARFQTTANQELAFYLLLSRFWEIAAGALLFQLHSRGSGIPHSRRTADLFLVAGMIFLVGGFVYSDQEAFPFPWAIAPVLGAMLSISGVAYNSGGLSVLQRLLQSPGLTYIGRISYSLYLWHWPVSALFRWTIGFDQFGYVVIYLIVIFLLALASYHLIELPIRTHAYLLRQKNWKLLVGGLGVVLASFVLANAIFEAQEEISLSVTKDSYEWRAYGYSYVDPDTVVLDADIVGRKVFVVGDSHAAAYRTMLKMVSVQWEIETYVYEEGGCAVASLLTPMSQADQCQAFYDRAFTEIKNQAEPGDIIFLASLRMPVLSYRLERFDEADMTARIKRETAPERIQAALEDADRLIDQLSIPGVPILMDAPKPVFKLAPYLCSDWFNKMNPLCAPGASVDREFLLELRQPVMDSLHTLESRHPNLSVWDPFFVLCPDAVCSAYDGDLPLFFDGDHLSGHGNRILASSFKDTLLAIWGKKSPG